MNKLQREFSDIEVADVLIAGMMRRGTGGSVVKSLAELIKNSDDALLAINKNNKPMIIEYKVSKR